MSWKYIGNDWAVELLKHHIQNDDVRHAYLFTGMEGIGRRTMALQFARALNCPTPSSPGEACLETCHTCHQIERMQHPDLLVVTKPEDRTEIIIDQIRDLEYQLNLSPYESKYRIALLIHFENSNENAQNALLKTLEEAPEKAILLITAESAESLLPTIASRCEVLRLRPLTIEALTGLLMDRKKVTEGQASQSAHFSCGKPGLAIQYLENPEALEKRKSHIDAFWQLIHSNRRDRFAFAKEKTDTKRMTRAQREQLRSNLVELLNYWILVWRDILQTRIGTDARLVNIDYHEQIVQLSKKVDPGTAKSQILSLEKSLDRINKTNLLLELEVLLLEFPHG